MASPLMYLAVSPTREVAMSKPNPLAPWDTAVGGYLANRRALGRTYEKEEYTLDRVRRFLVNAGATDLDGELFERWRAPFYRLSNRTRIIHERAVYNFCRYRRSEPHCFLPDPNSFARSLRRSQRHRLPWERYNRLARRFIPYCRKFHPYPEARFHASRP